MMRAVAEYGSPIRCRNETKPCSIRVFIAVADLGACDFFQLVGVRCVTGLLVWMAGGSIFSIQIY